MGYIIEPEGVDLVVKPGKADLKANRIMSGYIRYEKNMKKSKRNNIKTNELKFPVISKKTRTCYPRNSYCPICGTNMRESKSFVAIMGGAMVQKKKDLMVMCGENSYGFLDLYFHGETNKGNSNNEERNAHTEVVSNARNGQFDI